MTPIRARYRSPAEWKDDDGPRDKGDPGDFTYFNGTKPGAPAGVPVNTLPDEAWETAGLFYWCPCGCCRMGVICFRRPGIALEGPSWEWDGNRDQPTLSPSLLSDPAKGGCGWHGWLKAGVFSWA